MSSVNRVFIVGNLGKDPEVIRNERGLTAIVSIATTLNWKDKNTGGKREETEWHRVLLFSHSAEFAEKYLKKGNKVYVEGRLRTRKWTDQKNIERYVTEIIADKILSVGGSSGEGRPPEPPAMNEGDVPF